jgi:hypothetical protein
MVEETGVPGQTLSHNVVSSTPRLCWNRTHKTLVVIGNCLSSEYAMTMGGMLTYRSYTLCCQYVISQVPLVVFLV